MGVQVRGNTVKTTGATALRNHVLMQKDNDEIPRILYGDEGFFSTAELASKLARHQNGFFHAQLTFSDLPKNADIKKLVGLWRREYDPHHKHDLVLIEHVKQRSDGKSSERHYHVCMAMTGSDGKSLSVKHSKVRNEKIARMTEIDLGMQLTRGAHNRAVLQAFESDPSLAHYADAMKASGITEGQRPRAAFESDDLQRAGRLGLPLKETVSAIKKMDQSAPDFHLTLVNYLKQNGIAYQKGDRRDAVILTKDGQHIGSTLNRILGIRQSGTTELLRNLNAASKSAGSDLPQRSQPQPQPLLKPERAIEEIKAMDQAAPDFFIQLVKFLDNQCIDFRKGDRKNAVILERDGQFIASLNSLLGYGQRDADEFVRVLRDARNGIEAGPRHKYTPGARGSAKYAGSWRSGYRGGNHRGYPGGFRYGQAPGIDRTNAGARLRALRGMIAGGGSSLSVISQISDNNPVIVDIDSMDTGTLLKIINEANARNGRRKPGLTF